MRIIIFTPGINAPGFKNSHNTGFAIIVDQIAGILAKDNEVFISNSCFFNPTIERNGYTIAERKLWQIVKSSKAKDILCGVKYAIRSKGMTLRRRLDVVKYFASVGYYQKVLTDINPDVVHVHGLLLANIPFIMAAVRCRAKFMVTIHGLYSLSHSVVLSDFEKSFEFKALKLLLENKIIVSVVSSGIKNRIQKELSEGKDISSLKVVLYPLPETVCRPTTVRKKQIVCAGNLMERKNQSQLIRAIALLNHESRDGLKVIFMGHDYLGGELQRLSVELGVDAVCEFTGNVPREKVFETYSESFCNCLLSIDEGFGLSMMEGYYFGLPTICFDDIDAVEDIFDPQCTVLVSKRDDAAVARAIEEALSRDWDRDYICSFAGKFSQKAMTENYISLYRDLQTTSINEEDIKDFFETKMFIK